MHPSQDATCATDLHHAILTKDKHEKINNIGNGIRIPVLNQRKQNLTAD